MKKQRLDQLLSSLGYGSRSEIRNFIRLGLVKINGEIAKKPDEKALRGDVFFDDEPLDLPCGMVVLMNKPIGIVCSHDSNEGETIYSLLPSRWQSRTPKLSTVGRLDKDTSGLILITDNGELIHALTSPKKNITKRYEAALAEPLKGDEAEIFASGNLMLNSEKTPCLPAKLTVMSDTSVIIEITEGRYHQVRRMFAAVGNKVLSLHRSRLGELELGGLKAGEYRVLEPDEIKKLIP